MQEEHVLHEGPGDVFFGLAQEAPGSVVGFKALVGRVRINGDVSFGV